MVLCYIRFDFLKCLRWNILQISVNSFIDNWCKFLLFCNNLLCYLCVQLVSILTRDFIKEGWLHKKGPQKADAYRKRWMTLDKRALLYYEFPLVSYKRALLHYPCHTKVVIITLYSVLYFIFFKEKTVIFHFFPY